MVTMRLFSACFSSGPYSLYLFTIIRFPPQTVFVAKLYILVEDEKAQTDRQTDRQNPPWERQEFCLTRKTR